jgi:hypothetical protein
VLLANACSIVWSLADSSVGLVLIELPVNSLYAVDLGAALGDLSLVGNLAGAGGLKVGRAKVDVAALIGKPERW